MIIEVAIGPAGGLGYIRAMAPGPVLDARAFPVYT